MKKKVLLSVFTCVLALLNLSSCGTSGTNAGNEPEKAIIAEEIGAKYIVPDVTGKQPEDAITMLKAAIFQSHILILYMTEMLRK